MGGVRSFFIESKFFQLVVEEGGRYFLLRIFVRGKFFMRSVFMGKNAAQWLMFNIENLVVGENSKQFFTFREGGTAFTLQWSSNSSGQFLLLTELKAGGPRRSLIIPEGKDRNGWRAFGLELRKLLNPSHYAEVGKGLPKFIPQVRRHNLEAQYSRTFADVVQGFHGRTEDRKNLKQLGFTAKGKVTQLGEEKMELNLRIAGAEVRDFPVDKSDKKEVVGGVRREQRINEVVEVGEQYLADRIRFPSPSLCLNSKNYEKGRRSEVWRSCWTGRSLVVEVDVTGRRQVFWVRKKRGDMKIRRDVRAGDWKCNGEASKTLKWVPRGTNQAAINPALGLGSSPVLTEAGVGHFQSVFSGPSHFEVGESSLTGESVQAQPLWTLAHPKIFSQPFDLEPVESVQCAAASLVADGPFSTGTSSDEPGLPGTSSDEPGFPSSSSDEPGFPGSSSDEPPVMVEGSSAAGTSAVVPLLPPGKVAGTFFVGNSSDVPLGTSGKSINGFSRPPVECFLADFFLSLYRAGLVILGNNVGDRGGWESYAIVRTEAVLDIEKPNLAVTPSKTVCVVPGVSALAVEGLISPDMGLGGEESLSIPLLSNTPFGLPISAELNCCNENVECENMLDISRWVKNRLPSFSKLVGLPLSRHEDLCIALLQKIERETEAAKVSTRKVTASRKVVFYKDKGKRELRNLQSSVNYDGR